MGGKVPGDSLQGLSSSSFQAKQFGLEGVAWDSGESTYVRMRIV